MRLPSKIKQLLQTNQAWWRFVQKYPGRIRPVVMDNITKLLSCGLTVRGYDRYRCINPACPHQKKVGFSCKGRFCNTCGHKATEQWIEKQNAILPNTVWRHITMTMPGQLWVVFYYNRHLLNKLSALSAKPLLKLAKQQHITPGIFTALHTFGRDLKWHVHMHVSVTLGGLFQNTQWKSLYFPKDAVMRMWRYEVINLLRQHYASLKLPKALKQRCHNAQKFDEWLNSHYQKRWIVHFAKAMKDHRHNVKYLGRYIKRPPLANSRLKHYTGDQVVFRYLDHHTKKHRDFTCTTEAFIKRFIRHIPEKGFRLIRYYGFLANRVRGQLLPKVYDALGQSVKNTLPILWPALMKRSFGIDPLTCILCGSPMVLAQRVIGLSSYELRQYHRELALMIPIR